MIETEAAARGEKPGRRGYVATNGAEGTDREVLKAELRARIEGAEKGPARPAGDIDQYLSDAYLDKLINGAISKGFGEAAAGLDDQLGQRKFAQFAKVGGRVRLDIGIDEVAHVRLIRLDVQLLA